MRSLEKVRVAGLRRLKLAVTVGAFRVRISFFVLGSFIVSIE